MRKWRRGLGTGCLIAICFTVPLIGCGNRESIIIEGVLAELRTAYIQGDYRAMCSLLAKRTRREIGLIGHDVPTTCERDAKRRMGSDILSTWDLLTPRIKNLKIAGDQATGSVDIGSEEISVRFAREHGAWRLSSLYGTVPQNRAPVSTSRASNPTSASVAWGGDGGRPAACPRLTVRETLVTGGCELSARALMTLTTLNVFGDRRYARCMISFVVHIDHDGNVVFSPIYMLGLSPDPLDICGDIYACRNQDGENFPWKGRIEEVSRALASVPVTNVCFDTCLGRFSGRLAFRLDMSRGRTQLVAEAQSIGTSGLLVSGEWKLEPKRHNRTLDITAATP